MSLLRATLSHAAFTRLSFSCRRLSSRGSTGCSSCCCCEVLRISPPEGVCTPRTPQAYILCPVPDPNPLGLDTHHQVTRRAIDRARCTVGLLAIMSVKGIVLITRHGDRMGFYQSPTTYTASNTNLTVLGYRQEYQNGQDLRALYFDPSVGTPNVPAGSTTAIEGINATKALDNQLRVMADAAGEGTVIVDSTSALLQGVYGKRAS